MNAAVEQDGGRTSAHVEALEFLVRQQKDFIEQSAETWRDLLKQEKASAEQGWRERDKLDQSFRALSEKQTAHAREVANLQAQVDESRRQLRDAEQAAKHERPALSTPQAEDNGRPARRENPQAQARLADMTEQLSRLENVLRQRQEEIEQAWAELAVHRQKVATLETELGAAAEREATLQEKLNDANSWVFKLSGERAEREKQLGALTRERHVMAAELATAHRQMAMLRERIDLLVTKPATQVDNLASAPPQLTGVVQAPVDDDYKPQSPAPNKVEARREAGNADHKVVSPAKTLLAPVAIDNLMQPIAQRDKRMLLEKLIVSGNNAATGNTDVRHASIGPSMPPSSPLAVSRIQERPARPQEAPQHISETPSVASAPIAMRMAVPSRNPQLERQLKVAEAQVEWLRAVSLAGLDRPRKWAFFPLSWHLPRMAARFKSKGLFDGAAYLARYPDVAEADIDPLIHYLMHGMDEGRER